MCQECCVGTCKHLYFGLPEDGVLGLELVEMAKSFIYQHMHFISVLENIEIYTKTYIKIAATCFGIRPSPGSLHMNLAKVCMLPHNRIVHNDVLLAI